MNMMTTEVFSRVLGTDVTALLGGQKSPKRYMGTFHKTGTVLFRGVLHQAKAEGLLTPWLFFRRERKIPEPRYWSVAFDRNAVRLLDSIEPDPDKARYVFCIRDPRDVIVSAAYYHCRSKEPWLHIPRDEFDGLTYQEKINSLPDAQARFVFEMTNQDAEFRNRCANGVISAMLRVPQDVPSVYVTRMETLVEDTELVEYRRIFDHLCFEGKKRDRLLEIAHANSLFSKKPEKADHVRSGGRAAQYKSEFSNETMAMYLELFPDAAARLGYPD